LLNPTPTKLLPSCTRTGKVFLPLLLLLLPLQMPLWTRKYTITHTLTHTRCRGRRITNLQHLLTTESALAMRLNFTFCYTSLDGFSAKRQVRVSRRLQCQETGASLRVRRERDTQRDRELARGRDGEREGRESYWCIILEETGTRVRARRYSDCADVCCRTLTYADVC
jgi:hypothetical protein